MFKVIAVLSTLMLASPALAQHAHGSQKGPHGGPMEDVAGVHVELVIAGSTVSLNILDEAGNPIDAKGYSGSAMVVAGGDRKTLALAPSGSALAGQAQGAIPSGATITVVVKTAAGKSGQVKFTAP